MASIDLEDPLSHLMKLEDGSSDPQMIDNIQRLKLLISILRPLLKFSLKWNYEDQALILLSKDVDDVLQKVIRDFQPPDSNSSTDVASGNEDCRESSAANVQPLVSNLEILKSLLESLNQICHIRPFIGPSVSITSNGAELLVTFIDTLLQNFKDLFLFKADILLPEKKNIEDLKKGLTFLRNYLWLIGKRFSENDKMVYVFHVAEKNLVLISIKLCMLLFKDYKMEDEIVSKMYEKTHFGRRVHVINNLQKVLRAIYDGYWKSSLPDDIITVDERFLGFTDFIIHQLRELSNNKACFITATKDQIEILVDELNFLRCSLMDMILQVPVKELRSLVISTQALIMDTGFFICFVPDLISDKDIEDIANYLRFGIPDLLEAVDSLKQQASDLFKELFSVPVQFNCTAANELEFVNFLIKKLEEKVHSDGPSINLLNHQIKTVHEEILSMRKLFGEIAEQRNSQMEFLLTRFKDAVYQTDYLIDSFLSGEYSLWCHKLGLFVTTNDIKIMQKMVKAILIQAANIHREIDAAVCSNDEMEKKKEEATSKLVGLESAATEVIEQLTRGSKKLNILSIVGMPGLGKTTLANLVYEHPSVYTHFHIRVWCCVSQVFEKETLLLEMLNQIVGKSNEENEINGEDFAQKLYKSLRGRKYLIVLDDIWDIDVWNELKETFPDVQNGSRILFTTRNHAVVSEANSIPYSPRFLSNEESCQLLLLKLFDGEICPPELSFVTKRIARNCKGLPFSVVLVAGILKRTERKTDSWEQVAKALTESCSSVTSEVSKISELSYKHLPKSLKQCFLYFGAFPEDATIPVSKLIRLWISEGLLQIPNLYKMSLEQEAENYLNELVDRSLVMIAKRSSRGGVKACRIHDVLWKFCQEKLDDRRLFKEYKFNGISFLLRDQKKHIRSLLYYYRPNQDIFSRYRPFGGNGKLSERVVFRDSHPRNRKGKSERLVSSIGIQKFGQSRQLDYDYIVHYQLLEVLDLGNVRVESSADNFDLVKIAQLIHLRYLAVRIRTNEIPSEISNLQNLETFLLCGAIGKVILPEAVWMLGRLRRVLMDHAFFSFQHHSQEFFDDFSQLDNLKSISTLFLQHGNDVEKFLRRLPGIQRIGCKVSNSWDDSTGCNLFPVFDFLTELLSLKISFSGKALYPCTFSFPTNLKKLTMSNSQLAWNEISVIGQLSNLEVLKLLNKAFEGKQWEMREGKFQKLKFLKLESLDFELWNASSEHLPCLEQLEVLSCEQLEEIPSSFGEISTLRLIQMKWCSSSAMDSVKQILEDQRDMSNDQLNIIVVGPKLDLA